MGCLKKFGTSFFSGEMQGNVMSDKNSLKLKISLNESQIRRLSLQLSEEMLQKSGKQQIKSRKSQLKLAK